MDKLIVCINSKNMNYQEAADEFIRDNIFLRMKIMRYLGGKLEYQNVQQSI